MKYVAAIVASAAVLAGCAIYASHFL